MSKILIVYSTTDGQTLKICRRLQAALEHRQHIVTLASVHDFNAADMAGFDKIVIGASIRYGHHSPGIVKFIQSHEQLLESKPNAFFSVSLVARKPGKCSPETNPYLRKFLKKITWKPKLLAVFAGRINYPAYSFLDRSIIRLIMWITRGPTDPSTIVEYTDWKQVESFAERISVI